jgi:hypothetical protein
MAIEGMLAPGAPDADSTTMPAASAPVADERRNERREEVAAGTVLLTDDFSVWTFAMVCTVFPERAMRLGRRLFL